LNVFYMKTCLERPLGPASKTYWQFFGSATFKKIQLRTR